MFRNKIANVVLLALCLSLYACEPSYQVPNIANGYTHTLCDTFKAQKSTASASQSSENQCPSK
jgi:hypothetical protein